MATQLGELSGCQVCELVEELTSECCLEGGPLMAAGGEFIVEDDGDYVILDDGSFAVPG